MVVRSSRDPCERECLLERGKAELRSKFKYFPLAGFFLGKNYILKFQMRVLKRNGLSEEVSFDKVLNRLSKLTTDISVDHFEVAKKVCNRIYDGVHTDSLDELAANICSSMIVDNPDYDKLASRISISNHHKKTEDTFSKTIHKLYTYDKNKLISDTVYEVVSQNAGTFDSRIDYERDYLFDYFGFKTLEKSYLLSIEGSPVERPQDMWMGVSIGIHGHDVEKVLETYDCMSMKLFTHATPTLFNFGTKREQGSSCFLLMMQGDGVSEMYSTLHDCAMISKFAGGIGLHIHNVRANGSLIRGTNGKSTGIVPMLRVYNDAARHINQAGKRNGSFAIYIEPWHADIEPFLDLKKNHGVESERARDLFYALWIPNLFMERVQQNGMWSLMCPDQSPGLSDVYDDGEDKRFTDLYTRYENEGNYIRQVKAQDIWMKILESQIETGTPYMLYKDHVNSKTNQKNLGTIKSSNLCVASETRVLTKKGYVPIAELEDQTLEIFNGHEFSEVTVFKTASDKPVVTVETEHGHVLRCTRDHEFLVQEQEGEEDKIIRASDLVPGMRLASHRFPVIEDHQNSIEMKYAYTHGFLCGNSTSNSQTSDSRCVYTASQNGNCDVHQQKPNEFLYNDGRCQATQFDQQKTLIITDDQCKFREKLTFDCEQEYGQGIRMALPRDIADKYFVPLDHNVATRINWISGLIDSAGIMDDSGDVRIKIPRPAFLREVLLLLQTLGAKGRLEGQSGGDVLLINKVALFHLKNSSLTICFQPPTPDTREIAAYVCDYVKAVIDLQQKSDTYCFTEKLRNSALFEGVLTSQCSEIVQYTSPDEIAVCNLASVCLPSYVDEKTKTFDYAKLQQVVGIVTNNLNQIIDKNFYPIEKARTSNMKHRPIGIGVQGLADTFLKLDMAYESVEAKELNRRIFENIYFAAIKRSCELAKEHGPYESFVGSPSSQGILQFDMWSGESDLTCDWDSLKEDIVKYGLRNSLVCSPMPTASTSQIMGNTESFEPIQSNIYKRKTLAGEFIIVNKYLVKELRDQGMWSQTLKNQLIACNGSVQSIEGLSADVKARYKTVWEIKQKNIIDMAADRGRYIDQSQSMNLYFDHPTLSKLTKAHFYGWEQGLKTGMYYLRSKAKAEIQKFSLDVSVTKKNYDADADAPCESCSA